MKTTIARVKAMSLAAIALGALTASAEIKYWDNPAYKAFDVGDYVQDGLLLHYDGIRNAGAAAGHDPNATVWKNLGSAGSQHDATLSKGEDASAWTENGYYFGGESKFVALMAYRRTYTLQFLSDAMRSNLPSNKTVYFLCGDADKQFAIATYNQHMYPQTQGIRNDETLRMTIDSSRSVGYVNTVLDSGNKYAAIFAGLEVPTSADGGNYRTYDTMTSPSFSDFCIGGWKWGVDQNQKGGIKFVRYYDRVLSNEEFAWNRVVDEARFFGRAAALPVTNVVIASNIPIAAGDEPIGCYAVDGTHVFSAPASKVIKGRTYILNGYTIETWDGEKWGAVQEFAAASDDVTSYTAADTALVRLTWKWTAGDGLVNYDADDYVQYGLFLNYDGIRNAGLDIAHDKASSTWVNLGSGGAAYNMVRYSFVESAWEQNSTMGSWTDTGFIFNSDSCFYESQQIVIPTKRTMQVLVDANASEQDGIGDVIGCYNGVNWALYSICMRKKDGIPGSFYLNAFRAGATARPAIYNENHTYDYATAIVNGNDSVFFAGTVAPWQASSAGGKTGHYKGASYSPTEYYENGLSIGGRYPSAEQRFKGTIKLFRFYIRCLTDEEVAWNRIVDDWRYSPTRITNVVVATTRTGVFGNEKDGAYQVSGSYTFTAPESVTVGKFTYAPVGYAVQVWDDANGVWGKATEYTGNAYAYTTSVGKVRLLWRWKVIKGIRTLADYDVTDYIAGGLLLNYDGIRNAGVSAGHDSSANVWVNLGTAGAGNNAVLSNEVDAAGYWTASGYKFDGKCRFIAKMAYNPTYTLQFLSDAIQNEQSDHANRTIYFICGDANNRFAYATYNQYLYPRVQNNGNDANLKMQIDKTKPIGYVTSIQDQLGKSASVFSGTVAPVSGVNFRTYEFMQQASFNDVCIGGWKWGLNQNLRGGINYFRYYDRVLSEAELAWNREVDEARYFGRLPQTNVVVCTKYANRGEGAEVLAEQSGSYLVEGEWKFSSTSVKDSRGRVKPVAGYYLETLVDGVWADKTWHDGAEYIYSEATAGGAVVRITWCTSPEGLTIMVR